MCERTNTHKKHPQAWEVMKDHFDGHLNEHYTYMANRHVEPIEFIQKYIHILRLFIDPADLDQVADAISKKSDPPINVMLRVCSSCTVARNLFAAQATKMDLAMFAHNARVRVRDLEHLNFQLDEVRNFENIMVSESKQLHQTGHVTFDRKEISVSFLGASVKLQVCDPTEIWQLELQSSIKTIAVHTEQVPRLPWESLLLAAKPLEGVATTITLPPELLTDASLARKSFLRMMHPGTATFSDMRGAASTNQKTLMELDKTFGLETAYLIDVAEQQANVLLKDKVLALLPTGSKDQLQFGQVFKARAGFGRPPPTRPRDVATSFIRKAVRPEVRQQSRGGAAGGARIL